MTDSRGSASSDRMLGKHVPGCRKDGCNCSGANDSEGRKDERRKAKRRERQAWRRSVAYGNGRPTDG